MSQPIVVLSAPVRTAIGTFGGSLKETVICAPYLMGGGRWGYRLGNAEICDRVLRDGLNEAFSDRHSGWHGNDIKCGS